MRLASAHLGEKLRVGGGVRYNELGKREATVGEWGPGGHMI